MNVTKIDRSFSTKAEAEAFDDGLAYTDFPRISNIKMYYSLEDNAYHVSFEDRGREHE